MFGSCIKTYFNSLKYIMTVFGLLSLGLIIAMGNFVKQTEVSVADFTQSVKEDYKEVDLSWGIVAESAKDRIQKISIKDVLDMIDQQSIKPLIEGEIADALTKVMENYKYFLKEIKEEEKECVNEIIEAAVILVLTMILFLVAGFFVAEIGVRRKMGAVGTGKMILEMLIRFFLYAIAGAISYAVISATETAEIGLCILPFLLVFAGLTAAWMTGGPGKPGFGKVVNIGNYLVLLAVNIVILVITALIGYVFYLILNIVAAVMIAVSLLVILLVSMDMSASAMAERAKEAAAA